MAKKKATTDGYAVIANGGKQYLVQVGDVVTLEKITGDFKAGDKISFDQVLMTITGDTVSIGAPAVKGAVVAGEFVEHGRHKTVEVMKYKAKSRYLKRNGHRQPYTKVQITSI